MKYYVYIIKSKEGYRYTSITENLERRLSQHNNKSLSLWTKRGSNWKIVYFEEFNNRIDALKREKWLKSGVGRDYLKNKNL